MDLREWRKAQSPPLTLADLSELLRIPISTLSDLETGKFTAVSCETVSRIEGVTRGAVLVDDIFRGWKIPNLDEFTCYRAEGRAARAASRSTRQAAGRKTNDKKGEEAAAKAGHNLADLKKKLPDQLTKLLKLHDDMESDQASHRTKIKNQYDKAASETGLAKRIVIKEFKRLRAKQRERAEELELSDGDRDEIDAFRAALDGTPLGKFAEGLLASKIGG